MKQNKVYPHELEEKGFIRANREEMNKCKLDKSAYVQTFLSPAVINANCGWYGVEYVAYTNGEEYVFFLDFDADEKANDHLMLLDDKVVDDYENYFSIYQEGFWSEARYEISIEERMVH